MSNNGLKLWQESIDEYCSKNNTKYTIPKKGTAAYVEIKKIYDKKRNGTKKDEAKPKKKSCKCKCSCNCEK